jgi:hypothetical protein
MKKYVTSLYIHNSWEEAIMKGMIKPKWKQIFHSSRRILHSNNVWILGSVIQVMERNWEKEIGVKEGKKTAKIQFFRLLNEITLWDR